MKNSKNNNNTINKSTAVILRSVATTIAIYLSTIPTVKSRWISPPAQQNLAKNLTKQKEHVSNENLSNFKTPVN